MGKHDFSVLTKTRFLVLKGSYDFLVLVGNTQKFMIFTGKRSFPVLMENIILRFGGKHISMFLRVKLLRF